MSSLLRVKPGINSRPIKQRPEDKPQASTGDGGPWMDAQEPEKPATLCPGGAAAVPSAHDTVIALHAKFTFTTPPSETIASRAAVPLGRKCAHPTGVTLQTA